MIKYLAIHRNNELYETRERMFLLEGPFSLKNRRVSNMFLHPRYTGVEENLRYFKERYQATLNKRPSGWDQPAPGNEYALGRMRHYQYVEKQHADLDEKLVRLAEDRKSKADRDALTLPTADPPAAREGATG